MPSFPFSNFLLSSGSPAPAEALDAFRPFDRSEVGRPAEVRPAATGLTGTRHDTASRNVELGDGPEGGHGSPMRILLIEDDREAAAYMLRGLKEAGHVAEHMADGEDGAAAVEAGGYDVVVIDRMLPRRDGLSIVEGMRKRDDQTPVLILSALGQVDDRVTGLRAGGDDYLAKPYAFAELLARVEALARRRRPSDVETLYRVGDLELDRLSHSVTRAGKDVPLQPREFRLLEYLMKNAGQVVTRTMLLENVWDYHFDPQTNVIDVHISRLRSKIDKGFDPPLLHTVRGAGYMIRAGQPRPA